MKKFIVILLFSNVLIVSAQIKSISKETKQSFEIEAKKMVKNLESRLRAIIKTKDDPELQYSIKRSLLKRFVPDAKVEVANKTGIDARPIIEYLNSVGLYEKRYKAVDLSFRSFEVGKLIQDLKNPGTYYIEYSFTQVWRAQTKDLKNKKDGEGLLLFNKIDTTKKEGRMYLKRVSTSSGTKYKLLFDDIKVAEFDPN